MKSDRQLKFWFNKYNRLYFESQLPDAVVFWESASGGYGDCDRVEDTWRTRLNPAFAEWVSLWRFTLLHEYVHVRLWPYRMHGKRFNAEMLRLAAAGAFDELWRNLGMSLS